MVREAVTRSTSDLGFAFKWTKIEQGKELNKLALSRSREAPL